MYEQILDLSDLVFIMHKRGHTETRRKRKRLTEMDHTQTMDTTCGMTPIIQIPSHVMDLEDVLISKIKKLFINQNMDRDTICMVC